MNFSTKTIFYIASIFTIFSCGANKEEVAVRNDTNSSIAVVKTAKIIQESESNSINVLGIIKSESESRPSFKTGGIIKKLYVREGDLVKTGQLLATLELDEINAQVNQAQTALAKAERDVVRVSNLYRDSVATLEQLQNATTGLDLAKKTVEIALFNKNFSEVRSPINGKIIKQIMNVGEITGPGNPVFMIMGIGRSDWMIDVGLVDRDWARVRIGDQVDVTLDAYPGFIYQGYVSDKASVGSFGSGTFGVQVKLKTYPPNLAAGLMAQLNIRSQEKNLYKMIPIEALVKTDGHRAFAFTIVQGKAKSITLTIAKLMGDMVAISSGLDTVSEVITIGAIYLKDGDEVRVQ
ncbi:MAG: efflux RND transporter periplasmic adaptor subunit [Saprospiraceae bacterium]